MIKNKILFINPPAFAVDDAFRSSVNPPLNLAYLISCLTVHGHSVALLDLGLESVMKYGPRGNNRRLDRFLRGKPDRDFLAFFRMKLRDMFASDKYTFAAMNADLYPIAFYCLRHVKLISPETITIVGGTTPTECYGSFISKKQIDYVVLDEGENTLPHLIKFLLAEEKVDSVPGIVFKRNGSFIKTAKREPVELSSKHLPDYSCFDMNSYLRINGNRLMILSARGCRGNCKFCGMPRHLPSRVRKAKDIVREIEFLKNQYGVNNFTFFNSMMNITNSHLEAICQELNSRNLEIQFSCYLKADKYIDSNTFDMLKTAGCNAVSFGIESGSQRILDHYQKGISIGHAVNMAKLARVKGLKVRCTFIWGFPEENWYDFLSSLYVYLRIRLTCSGFFEFRVSESSEYYRNIEHYTADFYEDVIRIRILRFPVRTVIKRFIAKIIQKL